MSEHFETAPAETPTEVGHVPMHELGYGQYLNNPEAFIRRVIKHFFKDFIDRPVDWQNILHEARVALFARDIALQEQGGAIPATTSHYWWRAAEALGDLLYEDYGIASPLLRFRRKPFNLSDVSGDDPETAAIYFEKQRTEGDPVETVEVQEWVEHYSALIEGILLDNDDATQGERDWHIFELWVNGYSPLEIAQREDVSWLQDRQSVDKALRRIIGRLWEYFEVDRETHVMQVGEHSSMSDRSGTGNSAKTNFARWYANPENRARHRANARERMRRIRAERVAAEDTPSESA